MYDFPKNISSNYLIYLVHFLDFCLLHYLMSSDSKAMTLLIEPSLLTLLFGVGGGGGVGLSQYLYP